MLARAFSSWRVPSTTLRRMSSATITPVETSPITKLTATTAMSMMFIGSRSCCSATAHTDGGGSLLISFGPYRDSRDAASAPVRPESASDPSAATTSPASRAYASASASASAAAIVVPGTVSIALPPPLCRRQLRAWRPDPLIVCSLCSASSKTSERRQQCMYFMFKFPVAAIVSVLIWGLLS